MLIGKRETYKNYSSLPLGTYVDCSDYIYTVVKSKYDKILEIALECTLKEYDEFVSDYKKMI